MSLRSNLYAVTKHSAAGVYYRAKSLRNAFANPKYIFLNCIPKSGTHMINGIVEEITQNNVSLLEVSDMAFNGMFYDYENHESKIRSFPDNSFVLSHLAGVESNRKLIANYGDKQIFLYRDPRDVAVSYTNWAMKQSRSFMCDILTRQASFDDALSLVLKGFAPYEVGANYAAFPGVLKWYRDYQPWLSCPDTFALKFEDIIGLRGGGDEDLRFKVIKDLCDYLAVDKSAEDIAAKFASDTFNIDPKKSHTFHKGMGGKIHNWKKYFKDQHFKIFEENGGAQILTAYGYDE